MSFAQSFCEHAAPQMQDKKLLRLDARLRGLLPLDARFGWIHGCCRAPFAIASPPPPPCMQQTGNMRDETRIPTTKVWHLDLD